MWPNTSPHGNIDVIHLTLHRTLGPLKELCLDPRWVAERYWSAVVSAIEYGILLFGSEVSLSPRDWPYDLTTFHKTMNSNAYFTGLLWGLNKIIM